MPVKSFRAWNKRRMAWCQPFGMSMVIFEAMANHKDSPRDLLIELGSSIHDSKGCEIFEGDIIHIKTDQFDVDAVVRFERGIMLACFRSGAFLRQYPVAMFAGKNSFIVGNIHNNPERVAL